MSIRKINYTVISPEVEQEIKDKYTKSETDNLLDNKSDKTHKHNLNDLNEKSYNSLDDIPTEFNPTQHNHTESEITNLDKYSKSETNNLLNKKADLDVNAKIPLSQLPDTAKQQTYVVDNETERLILSGLIEGDKCFEVLTGDSYIWDGEEWLISSKADWENVNLQWANIVDKPNSSISNIDDAVNKKHTHNNLTLLQSITQTLVDRWNSAWEHISDTISHITSDERTLWNTVSSKAEQSDLNTHTSNGNIHVTATNKNTWNNKAENSTVNGHIANTTTHTNQTEKDAWNAKWNFNEGTIKDIKVNESGNADTVNNLTVETSVPLEALFTDTIYTHPVTHPPSIIAQNSTNRFVTDIEKANWNGGVVPNIGNFNNQRQLIGYVIMNQLSSGLYRAGIGDASDCLLFIHDWNTYYETTLYSPNQIIYASVSKTGDILDFQEVWNEDLFKLNQVDNKVDKVSGKQLSANDYTTTEKNKLDGIEVGANKYTHPANHPASIITESETKRFVSDTEKNKWNNSGLIIP